MNSTVAPSPLTQVIKITNIIYPILLSLTTTVGNLLSFLVFSSKAFQNTGSCFFFRLKSLVDIANVYFGTLRYIHLGVTNLDIKTTSIFWCYFLTLGPYIIDPFTSWLNVFIAYDRLCLVFIPIAYKTVPKQRLFKIQLGVILSTFLFIIIINVVDITSLAKLKYTVNKTNSTNVGTCGLVFRYVFDTINVVITLIIPYFFMFVSTIMLSIQLVRSNSRIKRHFEAGGNHRKSSAAIIKTVVCLDICFLVFNFPRFLFQYIWANSPSSVLNTLILQYCTVFKYSYYSNSILIYILTNHLFRDRLTKIFTKDIRNLVFFKGIK